MILPVWCGPSTVLYKSHGLRPGLLYRTVLGTHQIGRILAAKSFHPGPSKGHPKPRAAALCCIKIWPVQGPGIKGATIKSLVPFVAQLAHHLDDGTDLKHRRCLMVAGLRDFYNVLQGAGDFLDEQELRVLDTSVYECLANYTFLAHHAMQHGQVRYNVVHKHHMMNHLVGFARASVNPRLVATYTEESFVGQGSAE